MQFHLRYFIITYCNYISVEMLTQCCKQFFLTMGKVPKSLEEIKIDNVKNNMFYFVTFRIV